MKPLYVSLKPFLDHSVQAQPACWPDIFGNKNPLEVEIGIGNGEYLARLAAQRPDTNFVGFEEYCERVSRSLRKLSRVAQVNARVMRLDVRPAFEYLFAPKSVTYIHCLFPAPWPKKGDIKHRLLNTDFLCLVNSRLIEGGILKVVTDFEPYALWIMEQIQSTGFIATKRVVPASYQTKFEQKWAAQGQSEFYEIILTKKDHVERALKRGTIMKHYVTPGFNPDQFKMTDHSDGNCAVVFKDFLFDVKRQTGLAYMLVNDEDLLQHVRVTIIKTDNGWHIGLAPGSMQMPTPGIAKAIECVQEAVLKSIL